MKKSELPDAFLKERIASGCSLIEDQEDPVLMVLRHADVRKCAHNWQDFQSEAEPGRIVVPSEVGIRDTRQIPFEVDPPKHRVYRDLLEDWFRRPLHPEYQNALRSQIEALVKIALQKTNVEVVRDFALPLQSNALTLLLNVPSAEAETWISWGTHVFRSEHSSLDKAKASVLYTYIEKRIEDAKLNPSEDLYSVLLKTEYEGRLLTKEEIKGIMVLTFAGGRDTVINAVTNTIAYFADHPDSLNRLRQEPELVGRAVEELIRYFTPLTHMGRVATSDTSVCSHSVPKDTRISLCWASANRDANVFENPDQVILDRKVNPHVGFGFSHHKCLGATHARQILKLLIEVLLSEVKSLHLLEHTNKLEQWGDSKRKVGFESLNVRFTKS